MGGIAIQGFLSYTDSEFKDSLECLYPFVNISKEELREKEKREEEIEEGEANGFIWPFLDVGSEASL